jgi:hypothetical protein
VNIVGRFKATIAETNDEDDYGDTDSDDGSKEDAGDASSALEDGGHIGTMHDCGDGEVDTLLLSSSPSSRQVSASDTMMTMLISDMVY